MFRFVSLFAVEAVVYAGNCVQVNYIACAASQVTLSICL